MSTLQYFESTRLLREIHNCGYARITMGSLSPHELLSKVRELGEPHRHNGEESFVWDIKPTGKDPSEAPRSHTTHAFPLHTDCSYEEAVPSGVVLFTIRPDLLGGGVSEIVDTRPLLQTADPVLLRVLASPFPIRVPPEFFKERELLYAPVLSSEGVFRYREDLFITDQLSTPQRHALSELRTLLAELPRIQFTLKAGEALFLDNTRVLHGRSVIADPSRHLLRVRFFLKEEQITSDQAVV